MTKRRGSRPRSGKRTAPQPAGRPATGGSPERRGAGVRRGAHGGRRGAKRTGRWALAATVLTALIVAVAVFTMGRRRDVTTAATRVLLPPPHPTSARTPHDSVRFADFVRSEACASCHQQEYAAWKRSTHAHAGGAPSPQRLIADFDGRPIRFKDAVVIPSSHDGIYTFTVEQAGLPTKRFRVDGVIGGGHMVGGGTQGFVSRFPDGTVRFLPFDFIKKEGVWFCNTDSRSQTGYTPITPSMRLAECGDWPPVRVLGSTPRYANCQSCHGSQISVALDSSARRYDTRYTALAINCESCHGPGREHIAIARSGRIMTTANIGMRSLATLSKDASLEVCFQCHALKNELKPGYLPGKSLQEFYSTKLAILGDEPLRADGRVRTFAYQQNQLYSACYRSGSMTCTSCHDPHSQQYRDINGTPLTGRFDDRQCTSCHASKATPIEAHTHHAAASPGSRCVNCHMPYLQHPEVGTALRFARSDHTIPIPRPAFDAQLGVRNACSQCHADRSVASLAAQVAEWYGTIKPHPALVTALVQAQRDTDPDRLATLLLQPESDDAIVQFAALGRYVERVLRPNMGSLPVAAIERLEALAERPDLDIQALALASLHYARGEDGAVRAFLRARLDSLGDNDEAVRRRWVVVLGYLGDRSRVGGDPASAITAYRKALEILPDDARVLANLGLAYSDAGDFASAVQSLRRSLARDPVQPVTLVNLGNALGAERDVTGAEDAYRRALALNPREPLATFNLGNLHLGRRDAAHAIEMYERTIALDAALVPAYLNLARAYAVQGDARRAQAALERGLAFDPDNAEAREMLRTLRQAVARP